MPLYCVRLKPTCSHGQQLYIFDNLEFTGVFSDYETIQFPSVYIREEFRRV